MKDEVVLPEEFIKNVKTYLDDAMQFRRDKVTILQDRVIPSAVLMNYKAFTELTGEVEEKEAQRIPDASKESGMLLAARKQIHFFDELTDYEILSVVDKIEFLRLKEADTVFKQGEVGEEIYFIVKGSVYISGRAEFMEEESHIATLEEGSVFGEIAPVLRQTRSATATVASETILLLALTLAKEATDENANAYVTMSRNFMKALANKLVDSNAVIYTLSESRAVTS
jgi:hypothetical protein